MYSLELIEYSFQEHSKHKVVKFRRKKKKERKKHVEKLLALKMLVSRTTRFLRVSLRYDIQLAKGVRTPNSPCVYSTVARNEKRKSRFRGSFRNEFEARRREGERERGAFS